MEIDGVFCKAVVAAHFVITIVGLLLLILLLLVLLLWCWILVLVFHPDVALCGHSVLFAAKVAHTLAPILIENVSMFLMLIKDC